MNGNGILNSLVRSYYDVQRARIALSNRISAYDRGVSGQHEDRRRKGSFINTLEETVLEVNSDTGERTGSVESIIDTG